MLFLLVPLVNTQVHGISTCIADHKWCDEHKIWQCSSNGMSKKVIETCDDDEICEYEHFEPVCVSYKSGGTTINFPLVFFILVMIILVVYYMFFKGKRKKITHKVEHKEEFEYCSKCGQKLNKDDEFCKKCGGKVK